jgi:hypothetical protein
MDSRRRPAFATAFPTLLALEVLVEAFERGDYARVRREAPKLAEATDDPAVRDAAQTLVDRTKPDRLAVGLGAVTAVLLMAMTGYWIVNGKAPPDSGHTRPPMEHPR